VLCQVRSRRYRDTPSSRNEAVFCRWGENAGERPFKLIKKFHAYSYGHIPASV
jgi:hypothetical protein